MSIKENNPTQRSNFEVIINSSGSNLLSQFKELSRAKYMLWNMIKTAAILPYKDLALGLFWTFIRPILFVCVIVFIKNRSHASMGVGVSYPLYVFSGLIFWWYFVDSARQSGRSLYRYRSLITKIYFPRIIIPLIPVSARLFDLLIQIIVVILLMPIYGYHPTFKLLVLIVPISLVALLSLGFGLIFTVLGALFRDFEKILDFMLYLMFFLTPVIYSKSIISNEFYLFYALLNPMVGPLELARGIMFDETYLNYSVVAMSSLSILLIFFYGAFVFLKNQDKLAELVS